MQQQVAHAVVGLVRSHKHPPLKAHRGIFDLGHEVVVQMQASLKKERFNFVVHVRLLETVQVGLLTMWLHFTPQDAGGRESSVQLTKSAILKTHALSKAAICNRRVWAET
jgi:hypothetical protein